MAGGLAALTSWLLPGSCWGAQIGRSYRAKEQRPCLRRSTTCGWNQRNLHKIKPIPWKPFGIKCWIWESGDSQTVDHWQPGRIGWNSEIHDGEEQKHGSGREASKWKTETNDSIDLQVVWKRRPSNWNKETHWRKAFGGNIHPLYFLCQSFQLKKCIRQTQMPIIKSDWKSISLKFSTKK